MGLGISKPPTEWVDEYETVGVGGVISPKSDSFMETKLFCFFDMKNSCHCQSESSLLCEIYKLKTLEAGILLMSEILNSLSLSLNFGRCFHSEYWLFSSNFALTEIDPSAFDS